MDRAALALLVLFVPPLVTADDITQQPLNAIKGRTYALYVPPKLESGEKLPLLITLHGSTRRGRSLVERWRPLAKKERLVVAGPDSIDVQGWQFPQDGPDALYFLVQEIAARVPVDMRRLYVFGHSGGAVFGLSMGLLESEYFAAVSIHAGALDPKNADVLMKSATRRIPFQLLIGTNDSFFPLDVVRASRDRLQAEGFPVEYAEMAGHTHAYNDRAAYVNQEAWKFLSGHQLPADPRYTPYNIR